MRKLMEPSLMDSRDHFHPVRYCRFHLHSAMLTGCISERAWLKIRVLSGCGDCPSESLNPADRRRC